MADLGVEKRLELMCRGLNEIGYFVPMVKLADFLAAGCHVKILIADLHAFLDAKKSPLELLEARAVYYEHIIKEMLKAIGVSIEKLEFIRGTSFQLSREYTWDVHKLCSVTSFRNAQKAGAEVVKQSDSVPLSCLTYPLLQALDEQYLDVDIQFGGRDQRKIFAFCEDNLRRIGYQSRIHLLNQMVPGLSGKKMSASDANSAKIDMLDGRKALKKKVAKAYCKPGEVFQPNDEEQKADEKTKIGVLAFCEYVLFPILRCRFEQGKSESVGFKISRKEENGGDVTYSCYEELEKDFASEKLHPGDLKGAVSTILNEIMDPIRAAFQKKELRGMRAKAYPQEGGKKKKAGGGKKKNQGVPKDPSSLVFRAGKIIEISEVEGSDKLFVEKVDFGDEVRTIASGLRPYMKKEDLLNKTHMFLVNIKARKLPVGGIVSNGMIMCPSGGEGDARQVKLLDLGNIKVGSQITFKGYDQDKFNPKDFKMASGKVMKVVLAHFKTNAEGQLVWKDAIASADGEYVTSSLKNAHVG